MLNLKEHLLSLEKDFWKGDTEFYHQNLTNASLMVFAEPVGVLNREQTIETISAAPRWEAIQLNETRVMQPTDDTAILTYKASARREGDNSDYQALASSVYVHQDGVWKLAFHQQTPRDA